MAGIKVNVWIFESYLRRTSNIPSLNTHLKRRSHHLSPWFLGNHFSKDIKILYQPTTSIIVLVSASTYLAGKMAIVPRNGRHNAVAHMNFTFRMFVVPLLSKEAGYAKFIPNNRGLPDIINDKPKLCLRLIFLALAYIVGWRLKKSTIWEEPRTLSFEVLIMLAISQTKSVWILPQSSQWWFTRVFSNRTQPVICGTPSPHLKSDKLSQPHTSAANCPVQGCSESVQRQGKWSARQG